MAWLKNIKTQTPIPASLLKWVEDAEDTRSVADVINAITQATVDAFYPVGSIYMTTATGNPAALFGGTWERIEGRFLLAAGGGYQPGTTGGEEKHTLTVNEMPRHVHGIGYGANVASGNAQNPGSYGSTRTDSITSETGGNQPHNNMPPYLVVNVWKRTA